MQLTIKNGDYLPFEEVLEQCRLDMKMNMDKAYATAREELEKVITLENVRALCKERGIDFNNQEQVEAMLHYLIKEINI